jgi:ketopantoate reductase
MASELRHWLHAHFTPGPTTAKRNTGFDLMPVWHSLNSLNYIQLLTTAIAVRTPEEAALSPNSKSAPFDYVLLCVKALPDVYDMASVIESVVTPQHTCILLNTTSSIGVESYLEERYPSNVLLSLVCAADLVQVGATEFEHRGDSTNIWVGWANKNPSIPSSIQRDMAEALAMTLTTGGVQSSVSDNIRQQQFEKMIGSVALLLTPSL